MTKNCKHCSIEANNPHEALRSSGRQGEFEALSQ